MKIMLDRQESYAAVLVLFALSATPTLELVGVAAATVVLIAPAAGTHSACGRRSYVRRKSDSSWRDSTAVPWLLESPAGMVTVFRSPSATGCYCQDGCRLDLRAGHIAHRRQAHPPLLTCRMWEFRSRCSASSHPAESGPVETISNRASCPTCRSSGVDPHCIRAKNQAAEHRQPHCCSRERS
jgi:hypothetical protein